MKKKDDKRHPMGSAWQKTCRIMKLCVLLMFIGLMQLHATTSAQQLDLKLENASLECVLQSIKMKSEFDFLFDDNAFKPASGITVNLENVTIEEALKACLKDTGLTFSIMGKTIIIFRDDEKKKKNIRIRGVVTDFYKNPLPGVTVRLKGLTVGTATDTKGHFTLSLPKMERLTLVFSFIGLETKEVNCTGLDSLHVILHEDINSIDEVNVISTGYYDVDKRKSTSAVTTLRAEDVVIPGMSSIDQMLEGHVPGMIFMQNSGQVGTTPRLKIRGTTTLLGNQSPLWVVDGIILTDPVNVDPTQINDLDFVNLLGNAISGINPEDIEQIDILKDASATAIYGPKASNGVIVITTKKGKVGKPSVTYSVNSTFRSRPYYGDKAVYVMDSQERIDYSRELVEKKLSVSSLNNRVGYEAAIQDLYRQEITYDEFQKRVNRMETVNTDWFDLLLKNSLSHNHTLSLSGGTNNIRYFTSLGYMDESGNIIGEKNKRQTGRINLNVNYNKFLMSASLSANLQQKEYTPKDIKIMNYAYNTSRSVEAFDEKGDLWFYQRGDVNFDMPFSIINEQKNSRNKIETSQVTFGISLNYNIIPSVKATVSFSYNQSQTSDEIYYGEKTWYAAKLRKFNVPMQSIDMKTTLLPKGGELCMDDTKNTGYTLRTQLQFNRFLDAEQKHQFTASAIGELSSTKYSGFKITRRGYMPERGMIFDPVVSIDKDQDYEAYNDWLQTDVAALGQLKDKLTNLVGLIGSMTYAYNNTYIFNANARIDASNKFGDKSNDKLLPIWSVSGRWNMHDNILYGFHWVQTFALKASFGYQGNMSAQDSPKLQIKKAGMNNFFGEYYAKVANFPNPHLSWEKTSNVNLGLEFSLFRNKLRGNANYYYRHTSNAFMRKSVSSINGLDQYTVNRGTLVNQGFDFSFNFEPINTMLNKITDATSVNSSSKRGFVWRLNPNFGGVFNQLIDKIKGRDKVLRDEITFQNYLTGDIDITGKPVSTFYSYRFKGLSSQNGSPTYYNTDEKTIVDGEEVSTQKLYEEMAMHEVMTTVMTESGIREPFLQGGVSNYFGWRNWGLSFNLVYSFGNKIRLFQMYPNLQSERGEGIAPGPESNLRREFVNRWKEPGDEIRTNIPGLLDYDAFEHSVYNPWWKNMAQNKFANNIWQMYDNSNLRVVSGNYLRLQNVALRYVLPDHICKYLHLKSAYINVSGNNLFTLCSKKLRGQDPSQSGTASSMGVSIRPTYSVQLNITL